MDRRNTIQKELVLQAVRNLKNHATAEEVYQKIVEEYPSISKGTVYRNLAILAEDGLIRKLEMPGEADRYDHQCDRHYHVKCVCCGRICDVVLASALDLADSIQDGHGFAIRDYDILFTGVCPACREKSGQSGEA